MSQNEVQGKYLYQNPETREQKTRFSKCYRLLDHTTPPVKQLAMPPRRTPLIMWLVCDSRSDLAFGIWVSGAQYPLNAICVPRGRYHLNGRAKEEVTPLDLPMFASSEAHGG
jgi:hypothetical protein